MLSEEYGLHRVVRPEGVLPQQAEQLDPSLPLHSSELLIDVEALNIDAASFRQIWHESSRDVRRAGEIVAAIVQRRGKLHNPVTGSGGILMGRVSQVGAFHPGRSHLLPGERIASLVSLSLTPLRLEEILAVHPAAERVDVRGQAILFASAAYARLPGDLPDEVALAVLDVCGAPAQVARYVKRGMRIAVLGAGKAGTLCLAQARRSLGETGLLIAVDVSAAALEPLLAMGFCDAAIELDATRPVELMRRIADATDGELCDLVVNCASSTGTEMSTVVSVKAGGTALFFSMATSFTAATLGAEGLAKDVVLLMGNGYVPGHADLALNLLRADEALLRLFLARCFGPDRPLPAGARS